MKKRALPVLTVQWPLPDLISKRPGIPTWPYEAYSQHKLPVRGKSFAATRDEDANVRWPWIHHIQENGNVFYVEPVYSELIGLSHGGRSKDNSAAAGPPSSPRKTAGGLPRRLKHALKKNKTNEKKGKVSFATESGIRKDSPVISTKAANSKKDLEAMYNEASYNYASSMHGDSDDHRLICKNISVTLREKISENFLTLDNVLGVISGLEFDALEGAEIAEALMSAQRAGRIDQNAIIVQGVVPSSPVCKCDDVFVGDILKALNGHAVDQLNIVDILRKINGYPEAVLTIERLVPAEMNPYPRSQLVEMLTCPAEDRKEATYQAYGEICCCMLLTLNAKEDEPDSDLLFAYPDSSSMLKLRNVRGMFLTVADVMKNISETKVQSSALIIDEEVIHVCYQILGENLLVLAAPRTRLSLAELQENAKELLRLLGFVNENAESAFSEQHMNDTHHLIVLFMEQLLNCLPLNQPTTQIDVHCKTFCGVRRLQLPIVTYVEISNILSDSEAADYGICADDFFPHRRLYHTMGTCLFYKGQLLCNHMMEEDLIDVILLCKHNCLLHLSKEERLHELVLWREVFLSRKNSRVNDSFLAEYPEPDDNRWFILIVGQKNSLLCTLLEAGGAAAIPEGNPGPHPYYVDTALSVLTYLYESLNLESACESRLNRPSTPAPVKPIEILNPKISQSPRAIELTKRKLPIHLENVHVPSFDVFSESRTSFDLRMADVSYFEELSIASGNSGNMESPRPLTKTDSYDSFHRRDSSSTSSSYGGAIQRTSGSLGSNSNQSVPRSGFSPSPMMDTAISMTSAVSTKLTFGAANTLFHFTSIHSPTRLLICPNDSSGPKDTLSQQVVNTFHATCKKFTDVFRQNRKLESADQVNEQGCLFRVTTSKSSDGKKVVSLKYWVIGRLLNNEETYVCYHESVPQIAVEMAFKLRFGAHT